MGTAAGDSKIRLTGLKNLKRRARFSARLVSIKSREKTSVGLTQVTCLSLRRPPWPGSWVLCSHMRSPGTGCRDCIPAEKSIIREHPLLWPGEERRRCHRTKIDVYITYVICILTFIFADGTNLLSGFLTQGEQREEQTDVLLPPMERREGRRLRGRFGQS